MSRMRIRLAGSVLGVVGTVGLAAPLQAGTIIDVQWVLGTFRLELYDDLAPATVARFVDSVEAGSYQFSMIHFASATFYNGGLLSYPSCGLGPQPVSPAISPIALEATGLDNDPGTLAMVRDRNNPNMVTGEWILNFGYNSSIFRSPDFGAPEPVVIGKIIEGYVYADAVLDRWKVAMSGASPSVPTIGYDNILSVECPFFTPDNTIRVAMEVVPPANSFNTTTGILSVKADAGQAGLLSVSFSLVQSSPSVIIQAMPDTLTELSETVPSIASYDVSSNTLTIPELFVDGELAYTNLVFSLTDEDQSHFTLQSVD